MPTTGNIPITIPIFTKVFANIIPATPIITNFEKGFFAFIAEDNKRIISVK
jgi:hypothetical protein